MSSALLTLRLLETSTFLLGKQCCTRACVYAVGPWRSRKPCCHRCPHLKTAVHGVVTAQNKELRNKPAELQRRFAAGETVVANEVGPVHNGLSSIMNSLEDALGVSGNANL